MTKPLEIALAFPKGAHQEKLLNGVIEYTTRNECKWTFVTAPESLLMSVLSLKGWQGDGIIAALNTPEECQFARQLGLPTVNISSTFAESPVSSVTIDNQLLGEMAAKHLLSRGFSNYAYYGLEEVDYSRQRLRGFQSHLGADKHQVNIFLAQPTFGSFAMHWHSQHRELITWLESLPKPTALFAVSDYRARQALDACFECGLRVPQDIAVLGVDNEEIICQHVTPQLSSIARNDRLEGYQVATVLDQLIKGQAKEKHISIPPLGIVERASTEIIAAPDPRVREAVEYILKHLDEPFGVPDLTAELGVSRRWLEYTFRDAVGESPYQYIRRQRLELGRRLLAEDPKARVYQVASRTGFGSAKRFMTAFRKRYGLSPREYRRSLQSTPPPA